MENHFCNCLDLIHWRCNSVIGFACRHINTKIICKNCINAKPTRVSKQSGLWYHRDPSPISLVLILGSAGPLWAFQLLLRSDRWALLIHDLWCMRRKASSSLFMSSELWFPLKETEPHIRFTFLWLLLGCCRNFKISPSLFKSKEDNVFSSKWFLLNRYCLLQISWMFFTED